MATHQAELLHLDPDEIRANPENPRLIFRESELSQLRESIREVGIKVPLSIYRDDRSYVLLDGERRWRCARKLSLAKVPVLVQPEPSQLENILTMFNIHNVRTDWDLMPMALKLRTVRGLLENEAKPAGARELAGVTGLPFPTVKRALELLDLPDRYQKLLLREAAKPKDRQQIKPDLFLEINKSQRVIERYVPEVFDEVTPRRYLDAMVTKYRERVVGNVVHYRTVSRIARAERAGGDPAAVVPVLVRLVRTKTLSIDDAYAETVERAYEARDIASRSASLAERLAEITSRRRLSAETRAQLSQLRKEIDRLLGSR
jgi:ParB/RepB/Spo0J family partition protein